MGPVRASRLDKAPRGSGLFADYLPLGTFRRRVVMWAVVPLFVLFLLYLLVDNVVMMVITRHGDEFPLPDFTNQTMIEAGAGVDDLNLSYEIASHEFAPGRAKGVILNQFPIAGTKVKEGRTLKFVVSAGEKLVAIPNTAGQSVRQAMLDLETSGLKLGEIAWAFSDTLPERVVVFSYPGAGTEIPLGSPVNLMVNRGRASNFTYMPQISGLPLTEAIKQLETKSLTVGVVSYRVDENYLPETVLEQSEAAGTELDIGTEIDMVVSSTE